MKGKVETYINKDGNLVVWRPEPVGKSIVFLDNKEMTARLKVLCEGQKGCSNLSKSTEKEFPFTWLRNFFPQWQIGD